MRGWKMRIHDKKRWGDFARVDVLTAQMQILENTDYTTLTTDPNIDDPVTIYFTSDAKTVMQV
jgi:hypothetical protein